MVGRSSSLKGGSESAGKLGEGERGTTRPGLRGEGIIGDEGVGERGATRPGLRGEGGIGDEGVVGL